MRKAFTLVELIVVITILAVLATVAFISFQWYAASSRDSVRLADMKSMEKVNTIFKQTTEKYPIPNDNTSITYSWSTAWIQWVFWQNSYWDMISMSNVPTDPLTQLPYAYSVTNTRQEYQMATVLENTVSLNLNSQTYAWDQIANVYIKWDYNGKIIKVSKDTTDYILWVPSIIASDINDVRLETILTNQKLVYKWYSNLPASYSWSIYNSNPVNGFNFIPNQVILFEWDIKELINEPWKRVDFLDNLQTNYWGTEIAAETQIAEILTVDSNSSSASSNYVASVLNNSLKTKIPTVAIVSNNTPTCPENPNPDSDFNFDAGTNTITGYNWMVSDMVIPCKIWWIDVLAIWNYAFGMIMVNLTSITIPSSITSIWRGIFSSGNIASVINYDWITSNEYLYSPFDWWIEIDLYVWSATTVNIPNVINGKTVKSIWDSAFINKNLTSITLPNTIKSIWNDAFRGNNLTSISIPNNITEIWDMTFSSNNLISITIPNSVTNIWNSAFEYNNLTSITFPSNLLSIWEFAYRANNLTSITIPNTVVSIWRSAFVDNSITSVMNYDWMTSNEYIYTPFDWWIEVDQYLWNATIINFPNVINGKTLKSIWGTIFHNNNLTSISLPNSITNIWDYAFSRNNLTSITIPSGVTNIWDLAFSENNLVSITIPSSVTNIWNYAFNNNNITSGNIVIECTLPILWINIFTSNWPSNSTHIVNPSTCTP